MPDKDFEQQARSMADGFEMEPAPANWQSIREAISQPKRKRRIAFWWWLLPLCMAGGIAVYTFTFSNKKSLASKIIISSPASSIKEKGAVTQSTRHEKPADPADNTTNDTVSPPAISSEKVNVNKGFVEKKEDYAYSLTNKKNTVPVTIKNEITNPAKSIATNEMTNVPTAVSGNKINPAANTLDILLPDKIAVADSSTNLSKNRQSGYTKDSSVAVLLLKDSALSNQPSLTDTATNSVIKNHRKVTAWHWGILAEGGITAKSAAILSVASSEKSNDVSSLPITSGGSGSSSFRNIAQTTHGAAFGVGFALQKSLSHHIDFITNVAYHYQSLHISVTTYKDSLVLNNGLTTSLVGNYTTAQAFHFASLFAGFNWRFFNKKNIDIGVSAGLDNMFLLAANQKLNNYYSNSNSNSSSSYFSFNRVQQISDSSFTKTNYYKYQPGLLAGIVVNIQMADGKQLQLVPFMRSGIKQFEKNTSVTNNHLFSAGLRAVYFFK